MSEEHKVTTYPFPEVIKDTDGYPTEEGLNYIKNWGFGLIDGEFLLGSRYMDQEFDTLIEYLKLIWYYNDAIVYEDGLLEIHTLGWSGNEEIIQVLRNTTLWMFKHKATQTGGHYYFRIDRDSKQDWTVTKINATY